MKVVVRNYEIPGRLLFAHEEIKEQLKLRKCPTILTSRVCMARSRYWDQTMTTEPCAFHLSNPVFH